MGKFEYIWNKNLSRTTGKQIWRHCSYGCRFLACFTSICWVHFTSSFVPFVSWISIYSKTFEFISHNFSWYCKGSIKWTFLFGCIWSQNNPVDFYWTTDPSDMCISIHHLGLWCSGVKEKTFEQLCMTDLFKDMFSLPGRNNFLELSDCS